MTGRASTSFDQIADRYDETRGGLDRGRRFAAALDAHLFAGARIVEVGVGTGAVAAPLTERGHRVVGVDLAPAMLALARSRAPGRLVQADATALPVADATADAVVAVWAVHVVGDTDALAREVHRVLRPGGRFLVISAHPDVEPVDVMDVAMRLGPALGRTSDRLDHLGPVVAGVGLVHCTEAVTDTYVFDESPEERIVTIERRDWSSLWNLDDETWARSVQPVIDDLRALPEPRRRRRCVHRHVLSVYERPG